MKIVAKPIDVIAKFKGQSKPVPFKFRYENQDESFKEIKIDKITAADEVKLGGVCAFVYTCQSIIDNEEKVYEIKYIVQDCRWELYKI